ncbi:DUF5107 domain-containing protein [Candidatus Latescibacterota bacterium]
MSAVESRGSVSVREEGVVLPTYPALPADPNPMFLEQRNNQGASGRVYPNPLTDRISTQREEREYGAVFLENDFVELMLLPQIGGRVQVARDKTNDYDFFYRQNVIKPAFIGLFGPWVSGGMEFNWPLHHRPSTFMPVAHSIEEADDGSCTVWLGEHEPMDRTKGMVGICLHPGRSLVEIKVKLYNRTPLPQTFLWWVNMAVLTHEEYQVIFPPDVWAVTDHSKRAMNRYPMAQRRYYGVDFSEGVDVSWHRNTPVPASYFVWETDHDFFGGYDHRADAGVVHVANRHISPGKKFFTWGTTGPAQAWERNLTDGDGPYLELMAGVYTDNQPDFSWLQPFETKTFSQFVYPVQAMGRPKNANTRLAIHLEAEDGRATIGVCATEVTPGAAVVLTAGDRVLWEGKVDLAPGSPLREEADMPAGVDEGELLLRVLDEGGSELMAYRPPKLPERELPEAYTPPPAPADIPSTDQLYLTGVHVEQYRHPTIDPEPYWEEALARDPADARSNNALGLLHLRHGDLDAARRHLEQAVATLTRLNFNPRDGEAHYNLGLTLRYLGDLEGAYAALYKAIWSYAWQTPGYYALAEIDCRRGDLARAMEHVDRSLQTNVTHLKARNLKAAILRRMGRREEAESEALLTTEMDPLDTWSHNELAQAAGEGGSGAGAAAAREQTEALMRVGGTLGEVQMHLDLAFDYAGAGLWQEAIDVLGRLADRQDDPSTHPMVYYVRGYLAHQLGDEAAASRDGARGARLPADYCFPARVEEMLVLEYTLARTPGDARAHYYLGNLLYDKDRTDEAMAQWERAVELEPGLAPAWRTLGIAHFNVRHEAERSRECYERALSAKPDDGRILCELDQLARRMGAAPAERLQRLVEHPDLVAQRDDLTLSRATLCNQLSEPHGALELVGSRRFIPWEGGEGRVSDQYVAAHLQLGRAALAAGDGAGALGHFEAARALPQNMGEERSPLQRLSDLDYYCGLAQQALGHGEEAREWFEKASQGDGDLSAMTYYQAQAMRELGREEEAGKRLGELLEHARHERDQAPKAGFHTSVPRFVFEAEDPARRRRINFTHLMGLAHLGLGEEEEARQAFADVLELDPSHQPARQELRALETA